MHYKDGLICGMCRGDKVIRNHVHNLVKVDICPKCQGRVYLPNSVELQEQRGDRKPVLLKGQRKTVAIDCIGECIKVITYSGTTEVVGGGLENYVKTIIVNYIGTDTVNKNASGANCMVNSIVNIELTPPAAAEIENLIPYKDLDTAWAQPIIDNYIPNVMDWLTKEIKKQYAPYVEAPKAPPWQGA